MGLAMEACQSGDFAEKEFYLEEFRGKTLAVAVGADSLREGSRVLADVVSDLVANSTRVIFFLDGLDAGEAKSVAGSIASCARAQLASVEMASEAVVDAAVREIWQAAREHSMVLVPLGRFCRQAAVDKASAICARLRVHKLVIVDRQGGLRNAKGELCSFIDVAGLSDLVEQGGRREVVEAAGAAVRGGVKSVSICTLEGLAGELFSYQGTGTVCTLEDYCLVSRVGIDDAREVESFIRRGQQEGFLKPRSEAEIAALLPDTWGATIGSHRLAGVCALEQYRSRNIAVGEVVALCTVSRFKGGGVGSRLLDAVVQEARRLGLSYLFACTANPQAVEFFLHQGFRIVDAAQVPPEKWRDYDRERRARIATLRLDL